MFGNERRGIQFKFGQLETDNLPSKVKEKTYQETGFQWQNTRERERRYRGNKCGEVATSARMPRHLPS